MPGNPEEFQKLMSAGDDAAWSGNWGVAIDSYTQAIQIIPEDPDAHINLGLALINDGQLNAALKVYRQANKLSPDDPVPLEGSADALERMGRLKEAAQQYVKVSDAYLAMRDLDKAIANWERATQLTPGLVSVHARLAQAYERIGDKDQAVREYLTLAFNFRRMDDISKAIKAVERALRLDKRNSHALNTLRALKAGGDVVLPDDMKSKPVPTSQAQVDSGSLDFDFMSFDDDIGEGEGDADPLGPLGEAMTEALAMLASNVVEAGLNESVGFALQGMEYQRQGLNAEAVEAYQQADKAGLVYPSLKLNLGGLLLLTDKPKDSLQYLGEATTDSSLSAGALHGLGQAHYKLGEHKKASRYLIQSLRTVDTNQVANPAEIEELANVYESLLAALEGRTEEALSQINERFIGLLSGTEWKHRIGETRRHLEETLRDEGGQGLVDFLVARGSDGLAQQVSMIDRCIRQGLYQLAMDEAHRAVEGSPYYLPIHVRMAEVMMKEGRIRQAINKYNMVAKSYMVRGENDRAASILSEVLEMAPLDVEVRTNLIELLESESRSNEALDQYVGLANTYQQLGDFDRASETYGSAERMARRIEAAPEKLAMIKHRIADIAQLRLNTRQAQKVYEDILELTPNDEKALRSLVDIYYGQGHSVEAIKRLDTLLSSYANSGQINKITQLLEELVRTYPQDTALRSRMASIYKRLNRKREAIEQLDALGELQLEAGLHEDAANTIRQIIGMKPDRVEDYKRLLSQLGG